MEIDPWIHSKKNTDFFLPLTQSQKKLLKFCFTLLRFPWKKKTLYFVAGNTLLSLSLMRTKVGNIFAVKFHCWLPVVITFYSTNQPNWKCPQKNIMAFNSIITYSVHPSIHHQLLCNVIFTTAAAVAIVIKNEPEIMQWKMWTHKFSLLFYVNFFFILLFVCLVVVIHRLLCFYNALFAFWFFTLCLLCNKWNNKNVINERTKQIKEK